MSGRVLDTEKAAESLRALSRWLIARPLRNAYMTPKDNGSIEVVIEQHIPAIGVCRAAAAAEWPDVAIGRVLYAWRRSFGEEQADG